MENSKNSEVITSIFNRINEILYSCLYIVGGDAETNPAYLEAMRIIANIGQHVTELNDIELYKQKWEQFRNDLLKKCKAKEAEIVQNGPVFKENTIFNSGYTRFGKNLDDYYENFFPLFLKQVEIKKTDFRNENLSINWKEARGRSGQGLSPWLFLE